MVPDRVDQQSWDKDDDERSPAFSCNPYWCSAGGHLPSPFISEGTETQRSQVTLPGDLSL